MISQMKIQLNLYSHRENDNAIITNLGLSSSDTPNNRVRDLLYSLATGNNSVIQNNNQDTEHYINKISELEKAIENLKSENLLLKAENNILTAKFTNVATDNEITATKDTSINKEIIPDEKPKAINSKLLGSIKQMEV